MEIRPDILLIVLACAAATQVSRVVPLVVFARLVLPAWARAWLGYVPIAVIAALLAADLGTDAGRLAWKPEELAAGAAALAVAGFTRSLIGAVVAGVAAMALLRAIA